MEFVSCHFATQRSFSTQFSSKVDAQESREIVIRKAFQSIKMSKLKLATYN